MSLREKKFIRTKITKSNEPLVTISGGSFLFNAQFVKEAELKKFNKVLVYVDEKGYQLGFDFVKDTDDRNAFALQLRGGTAATKAQEIIWNTQFLRKINDLANSTDKRFPISFDRSERLYVTNLSPSFEYTVDDKSEIKDSVRGIYRYLDNGNTVYIGRGKIRSRANSQERKEWKFDKIQYSIVEDEDKQAEWETYWLRRYKEDHQGQLPFYNKIEGRGLER